MPGNVDTFKQAVQSEIRGIYTISFVRVEEIDEETRRAVVSLKSDSDILIDNVPVASPFARDGAGMITPIERGDEGLVMHAQEPLERQIQQRGEQPAESERRFQLEDAVLLPLLWLDEDTVPDHDAGEFQIALRDDGSVLQMLPDGTVRIEHSSGNVIEMDADGAVTIGDTAASSGLLTADVSIEYEDTQPDGSTVTKTASIGQDGVTDDFEAS